MQRVTFATFLLFAAASFAQNVIPGGTILPIKLNSSLNSKKSKAGQELSGSLAQDVPLASGVKIRAGTKLGGHIIAVANAGGGRGARLAFQFETLHIDRGTVSLATSLRAIASMMEVHEAQLPATGPDRGTPQTAWVTQQIEDDANYHGGWPVTHGSDVVGKSLLSGGVLVRTSSSPWTPCRDEVDPNDQPQALWVFASNACGSYGFADLTIAHAGRTDPVGQIVLVSEGKNIDVRGGSGMLLRVISSTR
ncbi:MAG TPA: hypothetical protein VEK33_02415 [Terriglobales bacterium]|nr:hypothetical protein [Terriglobales bacterium]